MKVTDYIADFLISKHVKDVFGYPGGVVCHFIDSIYAKNPIIRAHVFYHEQAAAFAACAYGQATGLPGVAFATSGPGALNLCTGIANAFFDSAPALFITGQVDTYQLRDTFPISQRGFQEVDIIALAQPITKYCVQVRNPKQICYELEKAWHLASTGRMGPVLLDLPADVQRADINLESVPHFVQDELSSVEKCTIDTIMQYMNHAKRPVILAGSAIRQCHLKNEFRTLVEKWTVPVVASMNAVDILPTEHPLFMGFVGTNGSRSANFAVEKCDLLLTLGARLDLKQVGSQRNQFAPKAKILRVDIDAGELLYKVREQDEIPICADISQLIPALSNMEITRKESTAWNRVCAELKAGLSRYDCVGVGHQYLLKLVELCSNETSFTLDVGHNEVWAAQALTISDTQNIYMSGGLGAMGYSLPAAIGVYYAECRPVCSLNGDGGIQMNLQELQFIARESIPIKVFVFNNHSLGMIRHFQEMNFKERYSLTTERSGYLAPDFQALAAAYKLQFLRIEKPDYLSEAKNLLRNPGPALIECVLPSKTYLEPKFGKSQFLSDQEPLLDRETYEHYRRL